MLHILNPEAIIRRTRRMQLNKGEYIVPGPDYIWSIDGHDKLSPFGIDIYACIDAYSRAIIWVYVGISNRTSHSVVQQYLMTCARLGYMPMFFRADKGGELPLIAEAHFCFSRLADPSVLRVQDCFYFGKSTKNQRIESWWQELECSQLFRWRVSYTSFPYTAFFWPKLLGILFRCARTIQLTSHMQNYFTELANKGWYHSQNPWDRIALLALYMPRIRDEVFGYADLWNVHTIRADPTRPNHVSGKPFFLYRHPKRGAERHAQPVNTDLCNRILEDCECWGEIYISFRLYSSLYILIFIDLDEYLPPVTLNWCYQALLSRGIDLNTLQLSDVGPGGDAPLHVYAYHALRAAIYDHMHAAALPVLAESVIPRGGYGAAITRGGALSEIFQSNLDFRAQVLQSGLTFQPTAPPDPQEGFLYVGDDGLDRGWSQEGLVGLDI